MPVTRTSHAVGLLAKLVTGGLVAAGVAVAVTGAASPARASSPSAPPVCATKTTTTFTQSTPVAIPLGPAVVTSTVVVSGAESHLMDVDAITGLQAHVLR